MFARANSRSKRLYIFLSKHSNKSFKFAVHLFILKSSKKSPPDYVPSSQFCVETEKRGTFFTLST